jgi:uncharacterized OsmC-like protein
VTKRSGIERDTSGGDTTSAVEGSHTSGDRDLIRTVCGREMRVGRLSLHEVGSPVGRVTLDINCETFDQKDLWASLTPQEARRLAGRLIAHAAAVDRETEVLTAAAAPATPAGTSTTMDVRYLTGETYAIAVRGHEVLVDQPGDLGGDDTAATPTELLVASLASCVAFYAGRFLSRHKVDRDGLRVTTEFDMATDRPARVTAIRLQVTVPPGLPESRRAAMRAVVEHCTVHNTLHHAPDVAIELL